MKVNDTLWKIEKELSIAPALEMLFRFKGNSDVGVMLERLFLLLEKFSAFPFNDEKCITILSHDTGQGGWSGAMTPDLWLQICSEMKLASARKIRKKQTIFKICALEELTSNYIDDLSISLSQNTFPDQGCIISLQLSTSNNNAWEHLQYIRDNIIADLGKQFFYAAIGYRFVMNPFARKAVDDMRASCMRYLGADLQDVVCAQNGWWWNKIRTINWQITINTVDPIKNGWDILPHIINYQTGETPSICDRNNVEPDNLVTIHEYKALADKLSSWILETDDMVWSVKWDTATYARWAKRWNEIKI